MNTASLDILVCLPFLFLPFFGPKPCLVGWYGYVRPQYYFIVTYRDFHLRTGLIQAKLTSYFRRNGNHAS